MPAHGVARVQVRLAVITAAASRILAPPPEEGVTTHIRVPPRLPDATEALTPAATPVLAAMVTAEAATTVPIRLEAMAPTTTADGPLVNDTVVSCLINNMAFLAIKTGRWSGSCRMRGVRISESIRNRSRGRGTAAGPFSSQPLIPLKKPGSCYRGFNKKKVEGLREENEFGVSESTQREATDGREGGF